MSEQLSRDRRGILIVLLTGLLGAGCGPQLAIDLGPGYAEGAGNSFPGLAGIPNLDDDDRNGDADWDDAVEGDSSDDYVTARVDGENDFVPFTISDRAFRGLKRGEQIRLVLTGDVNEVRIWLGDAVVLGAVAGGTLEDVELELPDRDSLQACQDCNQEFLVEFKDFLTQARVSLEHRDRAGETLASVETYLTASPLLLNHHRQVSDKVWVVDLDYGPSFNNQAMIGVYEDVLGDQFVPIDGFTYSGDQWIQDEIQFGWTQAEGAANQIVVDSIRDRPLDLYPEDDLVQPDVVVKTWGDTEFVTSLDYFGNLEVTPPLSAGGVDYPLGRIYWGGDSFLYPDEELTDFLNDQGVQAPHQFDTTWLCVSHIDEYTSFVPDPSSPKGFKFVYADTRVAWEILESMDPEVSLPRYGRASPDGHGLATVSALLEDNAVRQLNNEVQEDYLDPLLEEFKEEFALEDEDVLLMPSLFEEPWNCSGYVAALVPGMANLVVATVDGTDHVLLADPFMRNSNVSANGQDDDPFIAHVREMMPSALDLHFVDDWSVYHMQLGEVHCGTAVQRLRDTRWWEVAAGLIEVEE